MTASLDLVYNKSSSLYFFDTLPELQQKLLLSIDKNPGIRYRELLRLINSSNGVLSYHINRLEKMDLVIVERRARMTRLFPRNISNEILLSKDTIWETEQRWNINPENAAKWLNEIKWEDELLDENFNFLTVFENMKKASLIPSLTNPANSVI